MRVYFEALGCRLNEAEQGSWRREFAKAGYAVVGAPESADLVVLNTCAVTAEAARKSRKAAGRLGRLTQKPRVVLTGCFSQLEPERARDLAGVDLVVENTRKDELLKTISSCFPPATNVAVEPVFPLTRTRAFIKVQDGCRNRCSFCIVTVARGDERSRSVGEVVGEINELHELGHQEAVLTGVHLGGYGSDIGENLATLIEGILANTQIPRIRISSLEPWEISDGLWSYWTDSRLCAHLHLPLQSGSDAVLKRMARRCSADSFRNLVAEARAAIPDLTVTSDIIVGFPGESPAEFDETLQLVEESKFAHVHIFSYSARQGTAAARMSGQVAAEEKRLRSQALHELAAELKQQVLQSAVGQRRPVLWEEQKKQPEGEALWVGFTDNYLRCTTRAGENRHNRIESMRLTGVSGEHLIGEAHHSVVS